MAKPKSAATIAKEAKWVQEVQRWYDYTLKNPKWSPVFAYYTASGKPIVQDEVIIRTVRLKFQIAGYLRAQRDLIKKNPYNVYWKSDTSYLTGEFLTLYSTKGNFKNAQIVFPNSITTVAKVKIGELEISALVKSQDPAKLVRESIFLDSAVAMDWPDEKGICKLWAHRASKLARLKYPKLADKESDGLNRDALAGVTGWKILADYINLRNPKVPQRTVCEIVKTISNNIAQVELDKMIQDANK